MSITFSKGFTISRTTTPIVSSGLVFNLQTAPSSGTTWTDASGNGYNATLNGTPTYVSNNGGGIRLNNSLQNSGGIDFIIVPYNASTNTISVEIVASFNPTSYWATIWGNENYNAGGGYFAYMGNASTISYGKPNSLGSTTITSSNAIRHWIFVINGTSTSLYLNGTQNGTSSTVTSQTTFTSNNFYFGSRHLNDGTAGPRDVMNNSTAANYPVFYQMRLYNKALSGSEITQNYNAIKSTYGI